jgi:hypothetical protein
MSLTGQLVYARHVWEYCNHTGHIKECCIQHYPLKTPVQTTPADYSTGWNGLPVQPFFPHFPVPNINTLEGHATMMAQLSGQISSTLRIINGLTAGPSGLSGASKTTTAASRRTDAECFAQMSNQFFDKLSSTHMSETSLLENIQATFQSQNCENVLANKRERCLNSQLFKDMAQSFIKDSKDYMRKEVNQSTEEKSSLKVQL